MCPLLHPVHKPFHSFQSERLDGDRLKEKSDGILRIKKCTVQRLFKRF